MLIIGWDWASDKHDLVRLDETGQIAATWRIDHTGVALQQVVVDFAAQEADPAQVHVGIEQHDGPLIPFLQAQGYRVHALNPKQVQAARTAFCNSAAKDDVRDARVIAQMLYRDLANWRLAPAPDAPADELRQFCEQHDAVTEQSVRVQQQLRALLMAWTPELHALLPDLTSAWARAYLQCCPLPQMLPTIPARTWTAFFRRHRLPHAKRQALRDLAAQPLMPIPTARLAPLALQIRQLAAQLDLLCQQLAAIDRAAAECWAEYPDRALFASLPIGEGYLVHRLACAFGTDRRQTLTWQQVAIATGVAPVTVSSGKHRAIRRRRGCDQRAHQALVQFAFLTIRSEPWADALYKQQRQRGRTHHAALRQVARKWLRILYCIWYHQTPYDQSIPKFQPSAG